MIWLKANLTVTQPLPITLQERQMAKHLADTVKLMVSGQKVDYVEETLDFDDFTEVEGVKKRMIS